MPFESLSISTIKCARYYDPYSTKFLSEDPISFSGKDVNLYRYVFNNPLKYSDPSGMIVPGIIAGLIFGFLLPDYLDSGYDDYKQTNGSKILQKREEREELERFINPPDTNPDLKRLRKNLPLQCNEAA